VKPRHFFSAVATLLALLAGWFAPPWSSFDQRWPAPMAPAMPLQMFNAARKAAAHPSFCVYEFQTYWQFGKPCRVG